MSSKTKRRFGDRRDGQRVRNLDGMHVITPYLYPNRTDNEAFIQESIELASINAYVAKKNAELKAKVESGELPKEALEDPYKMFQVVLAAVIKTITLRPKLNRFITNKQTFQRENVSVAFVVKKRFADNAGEGLAYESFGPETTMDDIHRRIVKEINKCRNEQKKDNSSDFMDKFAKIPAWLLRFVFAIIRFCDRKGIMPYTLIKTDPNYASAFLTNFGSIGLKAGYHHLANWGTNSFFMVLGEKSFKPVYNADGTFEGKEVMDIGLTVDERIADGYYFSKSIRLFKKLLANPELLDEPAGKEIDY